MMNRLNAGYQPTLPRTSVYDKVMRFASGGEVVAPLGSPGAINVGRMIAARRQRLAALIAIDTAEARDEAERLRQEIRVLAENGAGAACALAQEPPAGFGRSFLPNSVQTASQARDPADSLPCNSTTRVPWTCCSQTGRAPMAAANCSRWAATRIGSSPTWSPRLKP